MKMPIFLVSMLTDIIGKWKLSPLIQSRKELLLEKQQESWQVSNKMSQKISTTQKNPLASIWNRRSQAQNKMSQKISTTQKNPLASIWNRRSQAQELYESQGGHLAYVPNSTGSEHECRSKMPEEKRRKKRLIWKTQEAMGSLNRTGFSMLILWQCYVEAHMHQNVHH